MHYNRLIALVVLANGALLVRHLVRGDWHVADGSALQGLSAMLLINLTIAVVIRQQQVLNLLFSLAGRGRKTRPRWLRWSISKVHHAGGLHVGGALAGTAGALLGPLLVVQPFMGGPIMLKAFAIVILGGFGNVQGTILAGFILGLIESYISGYFIGSWVDIVAFALLVLMLAIRPTGLIAERVEENV
jgi:hypothetical protein